MGWIGTLIVGGIIGWLASMVMKTDKQMGILANVIVGIIGSSLGFWLAGLLGFGAFRRGRAADFLVFFGVTIAEASWLGDRPLRFGLEESE